MSDINSLEKEINEMMETLSHDLEGLNRKDPSQRAKQVNRCQNKLIEIRTRIEAFELETLQLDKYSQIQHKEKLKNLQTQYKDLKSQFDKKRAEKREDPRFEPEAPPEKNLADMTGQELIHHGHTTQNKGMDALKRALGQVNEADQMADNIGIEFKRQEEVIDKAREGNRDIQSQLKKSREFLKYFARQVYTDKILMCMVCLSVICIIVIIALKIFKKERLPTSQDIIKAAGS